MTQASFWTSPMVRPARSVRVILVPVSLSQCRGTLRQFNSSRPDLLRGDPFLANETDPQRAEDYCSNHRNWPAFDAVDYLSGILTNFKDAIWIPTCNGNVWDEDFASPWVAELRRRLIEDYGWPHAFRRKSWQHDASDIAIELMGDQESR